MAFAAVVKLTIPEDVIVRMLGAQLLAIETPPNTQLLLEVIEQDWKGQEAIFELI